MEYKHEYVHLTAEKLERVRLDCSEMKLEELINPVSIQELMNEFNRITGLPISIIDTSGKVLVSTGWQEICTDFHRVHPETKKHCIYSDVELASGVPQGEYRVYKCKNKIWHVSTPIVVDNVHLGNILMGQFFFRDEAIDYEIFRKQARKYGFDEKKYIEALEKVPVYNRDTVKQAMNFYTQVANQISSLSFNNLKLSALLKEHEQIESALRESENKYREILATIEEGYYEVDLRGRFVFVNSSMARLFGYEREELTGKSYRDFFTNTREIFRAFSEVYRSGVSKKAEDWPVTSISGEQAIVEFSISLRRDETGKPIGFRGIARDITEKKKAEERITYLSYHDQLTGLYNRTYLEEMVEKLDREKRLPLSVIIADLNGLQLVNDTYGHAIGDEFIKSAAEVLKKSCRTEDVIVRWGGDEFIVLLPRTAASNAWTVCERITGLCRETRVKDVPLSIALGVASKVLPSKTLKDILKEAEDNMYRRKLTESRRAKTYILKTLMAKLQKCSCETEEHIREMRKIARLIAKRIRLTETELKRLDLVVALHDIGNISMPGEMLTRKGPLCADEWDKVKKHPEIGFRIARSAEEFAHVAEDILAHHEWWDGTGYPQELQGRDIPLLARITTIADAFSVMKSGRPYKKVFSRDEIIDEFKHNSGIQFDPELVEVLLSDFTPLEET